MDSCLTCGNPIMEEGKAYLYSGPVCTCYEPPRERIRKRARPDLPEDRIFREPNRSEPV